jgi:membrane protease YdiL (CAAX protease family)
MSDGSSDPQTMSQPDVQPPQSEELITARWEPNFAIFGGLALFLFPQLLIALFLIPLISVVPELSDAINDGNSVLVNFSLYGLSEILTFTLLYFMLKKRGYTWADLGLRRKGLGKLWLLLPVMAGYFFLTLTLQFIASLFVSEEVLNADQELGFEQANGAPELILAFVALVIIAPVVEEFLFRGFMYAGLRRAGLALSLLLAGFGFLGLLAIVAVRSLVPESSLFIQIWAAFVLLLACGGFLLSKKQQLASWLLRLAERKQANIWAAALLSAAVFGLAHGQLNVGLDTFALGIFLAYIYEKSGTIWLPIFLHANKNLLAFVLIFILQVE